MVSGPVKTYYLTPEELAEYVAKHPIVPMEGYSSLAKLSLTKPDYSIKPKRDEQCNTK